MLEFLFFVKLIAAMIIVMGLSIVTEKVSPRVAGILASLPSNSLILLFFIGLQNGASFASTAAIYNVLGIIAMQSLFFVYYNASKRLTQHVLALSALLSVAGYLLVAGVLSFLVLDAVMIVALTLLSIILFNHAFRKIEDSNVKKPVRLSFKVLLARAVLVAVLILVVTESASFIGPKWSGLLTAFPTIAFSLLLIVHSTYGVKPVHAMIKPFPKGLFSIVVYSLAVSLTYGVLGVYVGTVVAFAASLACCFIVFYFDEKRAAFVSGFVKSRV